MTVMVNTIYGYRPINGTGVITASPGVPFDAVFKPQGKSKGVTVEMAADWDDAAWKHHARRCAEDGAEILYRTDPPRVASSFDVNPPRPPVDDLNWMRSRGVEMRPVLRSRHVTPTGRANRRSWLNGAE